MSADALSNETLTRQEDLHDSPTELMAVTSPPEKRLTEIPRLIHREPQYPNFHRPHPVHRSLAEPWMNERLVFGSESLCAREHRVEVVGRRLCKAAENSRAQALFASLAGALSSSGSSPLATSGDRLVIDAEVHGDGEVHLLQPHSPAAR